MRPPSAPSAPFLSEKVVFAGGHADAQPHLDPATVRHVRVASFNINARHRAVAFLKWYVGHAGLDAVALQECPRSSATELLRALGEGWWLVYAPEQFCGNAVLTRCAPAGPCGGAGHGDGAAQRRTERGMGPGTDGGSDDCAEPAVGPGGGDGLARAVARSEVPALSTSVSGG